MRNTLKNRTRLNCEALESRELLAVADPLTGDITVPSAPPTSPANPDIAMNASGGFVVVYDRTVDADKDVYARRFDPNNNPIGAEFGVADLIAVNEVNAHVAMNSAGAFVVTWERGADVFFQLYNSAGGRVTGGQVNALRTLNVQRSTDVAMDDAGNFVVTFTDERSVTDWDVYFRRYNAAGVAQGNEQAVTGAFDAVKEDHAAVAMAPDGRFVVVWEDNGGALTQIRSTLFNAAGTTAGPGTSDQLVSTAITTRNQLTPAVGMDDIANYVVTWQDSNGAASDIRYALVAASGLGSSLPDTRLNPVEGNSEARPDVAFSRARDGQFVISYDAFNPATGTAEIYFNAYSASGNQVAAGRANLATGGQQFDAAVGRAGNKIAFAWNDHVATIKARAFALLDSPPPVAVVIPPTVVTGVTVVALRVGKGKRRQFLLVFRQTPAGVVMVLIVSPFQQGKYRRIAASLLGGDFIQVTAVKLTNNKKVATVLLA